jgi:hypothetical protein
MSRSCASSSPALPSHTDRCEPKRKKRDYYYRHPEVAALLTTPGSTAYIISG